MQFVKLERSTIRDCGFSEKWVQDRIADDPAILGLGDVVLKDRERRQPKAGRLDLLLQDADLSRRYEVEIQLGRTDESHIIRTIEYWDMEKKRYPQYEHTAVIVAEEITSRFLNVISLFNGMIPLVAIQMKLVRLGEQVGLLFTTVLDQVTLGLVEEDEETAEATDRAYWERRAAPTTVAMADRILGAIREVTGRAYDLKYNKFYIGLAESGQPNNFVVLRPQKNQLRFSARLPRSDAFQEQAEESGLDLVSYDSRYGRYHFRVSPNELTRQLPALTDVIRRAHEENGE